MPFRLPRSCRIRSAVSRYRFCTFTAPATHATLACLPFSTRVTPLHGWIWMDCFAFATHILFHVCLPAACPFAPRHLIPPPLVCSRTFHYWIFRLSCVDAPRSTLPIYVLYTIRSLHVSHAVLPYNIVFVPFLVWSTIDDSHTLFTVAVRSSTFTDFLFDTTYVQHLFHSIYATVALHLLMGTAPRDLLRSARCIRSSHVTTHSLPRCSSRHYPADSSAAFRPRSCRLLMQFIDAFTCHSYYPFAVTHDSLRLSHVFTTTLGTSGRCVRLCTACTHLLCCCPPFLPTVLRFTPGCPHCVVRCVCIQICTYSYLPFSFWVPFVSFVRSSWVRLRLHFLHYVLGTTFTSSFGIWICWYILPLFHSSVHSFPRLPPRCSLRADPLR